MDGTPAKTAPRLTPGERIELAVTEIAYGGRGLGRHDGMVVFVPGTIPGESVRAVVTRVHKNYAGASPEAILKPSAHRIPPLCPLAAVCPGCSYQHISYDRELAAKSRQLETFLSRTCNADRSVCLQPVGSPLAQGYRNKISLHTARDGARAQIGYIGEDNRTLVDVPECPLAVEPINETLRFLRADADFMSALEPWRTLTLRYTDKDGPLWWLTGRAESQSNEKASELILIEKTVLGPMRVPQHSFFQVNVPVADALIGEVTTTLRDLGPSAAVDLFCGVGVFSLAAARAGVPNTMGIDRDSLALDAARRNALEAGAAGSEFLLGDAHEMLRDVLEPLDRNTAVLVVDPPRTGLDRETRDVIASLRPRDILYVSCSADTMARDARDLAAKAGYRVVRSRLFDMFPRTSCFESLTCLARERG